MVVGCQPHAPAAFTPRDIPGTRFHDGLSRPQGHGLVRRKCVTEKSSDKTGNRSRDRPTSSAAFSISTYSYFMSFILSCLFPVYQYSSTPFASLYSFLQQLRFYRHPVFTACGFLKVNTLTDSTAQRQTRLVGSTEQIFFPLSSQFCF
jgi:hypothetical protein